MSLLSIDEKTMQTGAWETIRIIDMPASKVTIKEVKRPFEEPESARLFREQYFNKYLESLKLKLENSGKSGEFTYEIGLYDRAYEEGIPNALYSIDNENNRRLLSFDGMASNLEGITMDNESATLKLYPIAYSEFICCKDQEFGDIYPREIDRIPYAGIGVSTIVETNDLKFVLTRRGMGTDTYPGKLFSLGGQIKPKDSAVEGLVGEVVEESGISGNDFDVNNLFITALGADSNYMGGGMKRPELVAYLKANISWDEVVQRYTKTKPQLDVSDIIPFPSDNINFGLELSRLHKEDEMIPQLELGLLYAFLKKQEIENGPEGISKLSRDLIGRLN